jgi:peptidyl-prolyl cis-trans isomerase A (cyclophilin A)
MKRSLVAAVLVAAIVTGVAAASGPTLLNPATLNATAPAVFSAKFVTTKGDFVVKVTRSWAPNGADRFYNLVLNKFYDDQPIYRVVQGFIAQWGISMNPPVAKVWKHAFIKDDLPTGNDAKGTLAFAHVLGVKNSRTTQVFVNYGANKRNLGMSFPAFGIITSGFPVVTKLYHGRESAIAYSNQQRMIEYGAHWVKKNFPHLDWIETARIVG